MALRFGWYSASVFGKKWMRLMGLSTEELKAEQKKMGPMYALAFLGAIAMAYVLTPCGPNVGGGVQLCADEYWVILWFLDVAGVCGAGAND